MLLRHVEPAERGQLIPLWRAAVEATHDFLRSDEIDAYELAITKYLPSMPEIWVADEGGQAVGFLASHGGAIEMLFVDPAHHGQGTGRKLVEQLAESYGHVTVDVNEENAGGRHFYAALGFSVIGRSELDAEGQPHPILHLERRREEHH